jgi:hypothetical protein
MDYEIDLFFNCRKKVRIMFITVFVTSWKSSIEGKIMRHCWILFGMSHLRLYISIWFFLKEQEELEEECLEQEEMENKRAWRDSNSRPAA